MTTTQARQSGDASALGSVPERPTGAAMGETRQYAYRPGTVHPLGAIPDAGGVSFSVFSQNASAVHLLLFTAHDDTEPFQTIPLFKIFYFWHVYVEGLRPGVHYVYKVDGPRSADDLHFRGHRFNPDKVLIDPYARGNTATLWDRGAATGDQPNLSKSMRSVVIDMEDYDWEGDAPLRRPFADTVVYEMHVRGFTQAENSDVAHRGTFAGVVDKIPYLKDLGVTAVELLPIMEFDPTEVSRTNPLTGAPLANYWGYSTVGFFGPHSGYCVAPQGGNHVREFRDMVKALHKAGIEVFLDVVFNHTSEGNQDGPTIHFKGYDNSVYYQLAPQDRQYYMDYTGCGHTVNCNHPLAEKLIVDSLEFWVREMHVDGFRFDEGSVLSRGEDGRPLPHPPVVWQVELSEVLADSKVIAEAWDADGLYQIGYFPGTRWAEWNGRFRDDVRRYVRGDFGVVPDVARRIAGSADLYQPTGRLPINSVNFITCHDGFTLNDLVSYNEKHNDANGESNRDGINDNVSWNCGAEGQTADEWVERLRRQQIKNFAAILLLARGVPMILGGDEMRRTQQGNNNAYCQDNELSWFNWDQAREHAEIVRFHKEMIALRGRYPAVRRPDFFNGGVDGANARGFPDIAWHGCRLHAPGWNDSRCRVLAFTLGGQADEADLHVILNMEDAPLDFDIPAAEGLAWRRLVDTSRAAPDDILPPAQAPIVSGTSYPAAGRSVVVLASS